VLLALSWTVAAVGEEIVYRGYIPRRVSDVFGENTTGLLIGIGLSSVLFGLIHTEQGIIGVVLTFLDALFFSFLKWRFRNLWPLYSVMASTTPSA
jgi:membrane protease YdiL (CAAX protease family)